MAIEPLYTIKEVADYFKLSPRTIERYISEKTLDAVIMGAGRGKRVTETQIKEFIKRRTPVVKRPKFD